MRPTPTTTRTQPRSRPFPQIDDAYNALTVGQVDAVINDLPVGQTPPQKQPAASRSSQDFPTDEQYGIVVPQGNTALLEAVNEALQEVKDDGTLDELYQE